MDRCLQIQKLPQICDHQITLFYFFEKQVNLQSFDDAALDKIGFPNTLSDSIYKHLKIAGKNGKSKPLWKTCSYNTTPDFLDTIKNLFHGKPQKAIQTYQIDKTSLKLFSGNKVRNINDTEIPLKVLFNKATQERLNACHEKTDPAQLQLQDIYCHQFKTGFSVVEVRLAIKSQDHTLSPNLLLETVYSLIRINNISWTDKINKKGLGAFIRAIFSRNNSKPIKRVYTHTYLQFKEDVDQAELETYLIKLSRHYNNEYHLCKEEQNRQFSYLNHEFSNITHCLTHEGATSSNIIKENSPEFIKNYKTNVINKVHLPLHLLTFHTEKALQHYARQNTFWIHAGKHETLPESSHSLLNTLQKQQLQLLNFELNFFQPVISHISTHNKLYQQLLQAKQLQQEQQKINNNNQVISQLIQQELSAEKEKEKNHKNLEYCKIARIGVAAASFLTIKTIITELGEFLMGFADKEGAFYEMIHHQNIIGASSITAAIIGAIVTFFLANSRCKNASSNHAHGPASQAHHTVHRVEFLHNSKKNE